MFFNNSLIQPLKNILINILEEETINVLLSLIEANYICRKTDNLNDKDDFLKTICEILLELISKCSDFYLNNGETAENVKYYFEHM